MLLDDIINDLKLNNLEVKDNNIEDIFNLYKGNEEFAKLSNDYPITIEHVKRDLEGIPSSMDISSKIFISIYNKQDELVAVLDIIDGYSYQNNKDEEAIWIGLLEIDKDKHNTGIGSIIVNSVVDSCKVNDKARIQLGVITENKKGFRLWSKMGFEVFKEVTSGELTLFLMEKSI